MAHIHSGYRLNFGDFHQISINIANQIWSNIGHRLKLTDMPFLVMSLSN